MSATQPLVDAEIYRALEAAKHAADLGKNEEALAQLVSLQVRAPDDPRILGNLAAFQLHQNLFQDALKTLAAWQKSEPKSPLVYYHLGLAFNGAGDAWQASENFRKALDLRPDLAEAAFELGRLLKGTPRAGEAFEACLRAADRLFAAGVHRDAIALYSQAFTIQAPTPAQAYQQGMAFLSIDDFAEAERAFGHAREHGDAGEQAQSLNALAVVALRQNRLERADELLNEAIARQSIFPQAYNNRGNLRLRQGRNAEAVEAYQYAVRQFPGYKEAWFNLALELERAGPVAPALDALDQVVRLDGKHAPAHFARARALLRVGRWREGWAGYLWRWAALGGRATYCPDPRRSDGGVLPLPRRLDFRNLRERRVVLLPEPLPAEEVMFARFVPWLVASGVNVQLAASERIGSMLVECAALPMFDGTFREDDLLLPTGDIPYAFGLDHASDIPAPLALQSTSLMEPQVLAQRLAGFGAGPYLAVSWRSLLSSANAVPESLSPAQVANWVREWPGVAVCVQPDATQEACDAIARLAGKPLHAMGDVSTVPSRLAALLGQMQAFVGVSGLPMHMAASVGIPCDVLVRAGDEWCLGDGEASAWYPDVRLHRLAEGLTADEVAARIATVWTR